MEPVSTETDKKSAPTNGAWNTVTPAGILCSRRLPGSGAGPSPDRLIIGSEGSLLVRDPWLIRDAGLELRRGDTVEQIAVENPDRYQLELENLADAAEGLAAPLLGRDDALGQARTIDALYRAAETGEVVRPGT